MHWYKLMYSTYCILYSSQSSLLALLHNPAGPHHCQSMWDGVCQSGLLPCLPRWADPWLECVLDDSQMAGCAGGLHHWCVHCRPSSLLHPSGQQWVCGRTCEAHHVRHRVMGHVLSVRMPYVQYVRTAKGILFWQWISCRGSPSHFEYTQQVYTPLILLSTYVRYMTRKINFSADDRAENPHISAQTISGFRADT